MIAEDIHSPQGRESEANVFYMRGLCSRQHIEGGIPQNPTPPNTASPPPAAKSLAKPRSARKAPSAEKYVPPGIRNTAAASPPEQQVVPLASKGVPPVSNGRQHGRSSPREPAAKEKDASPAKNGQMAPGGKSSRETKGRAKSSPREPPGSLTAEGAALPANDDGKAGRRTHREAKSGAKSSPKEPSGGILAEKGASQLKDGGKHVRETSREGNSGAESPVRRQSPATAGHEGGVVVRTDPETPPAMPSREACPNTQERRPPDSLDALNFSGASPCTLLVEFPGGAGECGVVL